MTKLVPGEPSPCSCLRAMLPAASDAVESFTEQLIYQLAERARTTRLHRYLLDVLNDDCGGDSPLDSARNSAGGQRAAATE
jgi:hypothetical protein